MGMPLISVIVPSLRPSQIVRCLASIERYTGDIDYEVVVVSPFDIQPHPNVVHVKEAKSEGVYKAVSNGFEQAKGEYVICLCDECRATPLWAANMIAFMRPHDDEIFEGSFRQFHAKGEEPEFTIYGKLYAPFSCIRRDKVASIAGLLDCRYKSFCGDPDLSLRVWSSGGRVETCPNAWLYTAESNDDVHKSNLGDYLIADEEAFLRRWHHIWAQPTECKTFRACHGVRKLPLALPPEECVKLYVSIQRGDWETVKNVLFSNRSDACVFPESLPILYDYAIKMLSWPHSPKKTAYAVIKWLRKKGYAPSPFDARLLKESLLTREQGWRAVIYFALRVIRLILIIIFNFVMRLFDRT